ncbi:MAG: hypothetical protein K8R59_03495, partial [Thermoanaerobaculales bacterium]|nr:hypothetical protein [Thermoanaerobaculales bacterium]
MRAEFHLAHRYLIGLRRRTHVATVTLISLVGLGLGVVALIVTLALLEGFQSNIRRDLVERAEHARVSAEDGCVLKDPQELALVLQEELPDVEIVSVVRGTCLVASLSDAVPASLVGRSDVIGVQADQVLAARLGIGVGDSLDVISSRRRLTPLGPVPLRARVKVERVTAPEPGVESGVLKVPLDLAQRVLWGGSEVGSLSLRTANDPWSLGDRVRGVLAGSEGVQVEGVEELHSALLLALSLERILIFVAVGLILVVASLNLLCNVAMIAAEKRRDLAVIAGMGMEAIRIRRLFLLLGLGIGVAGALGGASLGIAIAWILDATGALALPRG